MSRVHVTRWVTTAVLMLSIAPLLSSLIIVDSHRYDHVNICATAPEGDMLSRENVTFQPNLTCQENSTKAAYPMDLVTFNCTVQNDGDMVDDFRVITSNVYGWDIVTYPDKFTRIPPAAGPCSENQTIRSLTLRIVVGDLYNATASGYAIDVTLKSMLNPSNRSTLTFTVDVLLLHRPNIIAPDPAYRLPGEDVLYEFQIQNLGNGDDIFDVWVESSDYEWVVQLVDPNQEILELQQWRTVIIPVIVYLPEDVDAGHAQITTLVVRPHENPQSMQERDFVQTMVTHIYEIQVNNELERKKDGEPGGYVTFNFEIINKGNDLDDVIGSSGTFVVSRAPDIPTEWDTWLDSSDIREGGLPKDLEADIEFKVKVPPSTPVGEYDFSIDVLSDRPLKFQAEATFTVDVQPDYNAEMEFNTTLKSGKIRENVSFSCLLRNIGNIEDTYSWEIDSDYDSWVYIEEPVFDVDFGYTYEPEFKIGIPGDTPAGTYDFILKMGSTGDGNITFEKKFRLRVTETLDFDFMGGGETYDAIPRGETTVKLRIRNSGNADVTLSFEIFGEHWGLLGKKNLFLQYKETKEVPISFKPPENVKRKGYTFEILGGITVGADVIKRTTVNIRVVEFEFGITNPYLVGRNPMEEYSIKYDETSTNRHMFRTFVLNKGNQFFDSGKFGQEITVEISLNEQIIHSENITELAGNSYYPITFNYSFHIAADEEFLLFNLNAKLSGVKDADQDNDVGVSAVRVIGSPPTELPDDPGGLVGISTSDWVYIFLIILISFSILLTLVIMIRRKYNVEKLAYDAKGDYDFSEEERDSFLNEEGGFDDDPDPDEDEAAMMEMAYAGQPGQEMYQEMYGQPGFDPYAYGGEYDQYGEYAGHGNNMGGYEQPWQGQEAFAAPFQQPEMAGAPPVVPAALPQGTQPQVQQMAATTVPPAQLAPAQQVAGVALPQATAAALPEAQKALPPAGGMPEEKRGPVIVTTKPAPETPAAQPAGGPGEQKRGPVIVATAPMGSAVQKTSPAPTTQPVPARTAPTTTAVPQTVAKTAPIPAQTQAVVAKTAPVPQTAQTSQPQTTSENISDTTKRLEDILAKLKT